MKKPKKPKNLRKSKTPNDALPVGRIAGLFGVRGELKCDPTNAGRDLFRPGELLTAILQAGESQAVRVKSAREHQRRLLVFFEGIDSPEKAQPLIGAELHVESSRIVLQPNEYLDRDLIGCVLYDRGHAIGAVERVDHYPNSDMLIVNGKLVPLIDEFVKNVDLKSKRIDVALPAGLLDD